MGIGKLQTNSELTKKELSIDEQEKLLG